MKVTQQGKYGRSLSAFSPHDRPLNSCSTHAICCVLGLSLDKTYLVTQRLEPCRCMSVATLLQQCPDGCSRYMKLKVSK
jgi:hypothetical protein